MMIMIADDKTNKIAFKHRAQAERWVNDMKKKDGKDAAFEIELIA
jgi:hypothetical protein